MCARPTTQVDGDALHRKAAGATFVALAKRSGPSRHRRPPSAPVRKRVATPYPEADILDDDEFDELDDLEDTGSVRTETFEATPEERADILGEEESGSFGRRRTMALPADSSFQDDAFGELGMPVEESVRTAAPRLPSLAMTPIPEQPAPPVVQGTAVQMGPRLFDRPRNPGIHSFLIGLAAEGGSDLHLATGSPPKMRKYAKMGGLPGHDTPLAGRDVFRWLMEIAPKEAQARYYKTYDVDYAYEIPEIARYRINIFKDRRGPAGAIRIVPTVVRSLDELRLPRVVNELCTLDHGMVLVTGATGQGKSTTLAAILDHINQTRDCHIITIEDPVEFVHETRRALVNQREVGLDTASAEAAIRSAMREDPDVIMIGEFRDMETLAIALETAETGHLVLGSLHTTSAMRTIDRIVDQFPSDRHSQVRTSLAESLRAIIAQTLCVRDKGGMVAAVEVLVVTPSVSNMIRENKTHQLASAMQTGKKDGMQTLNEALVKLVKKGIIAPSQGLRKSTNKTEYKTVLDKAGINTER